MHPRETSIGLKGSYYHWAQSHFITFRLCAFVLELGAKNRKTALKFAFSHLRSSISLVSTAESTGVVLLPLHPCILHSQSELLAVHPFSLLLVRCIVCSRDSAGCGAASMIKLGDMYVYTEV